MITRVERNRKTPRVIAFLNRICAAYPRGRLLIITDNISTRTGRIAKKICNERGLCFADIANANDAASAATPLRAG